VPQVLAGAPQVCAARSKRRHAPVLLHDACEDFGNTSDNFPQWAVIRLAEHSGDVQETQHMEKQGEP
jgi:hypothetical protein